jgi:hypothetical protein
MKVTSRLLAPTYLSTKGDSQCQAHLMSSAQPRAVSTSYALGNRCIAGQSIWASEVTQDAWPESVCAAKACQKKPILQVNICTYDSSGSNVAILQIPRALCPG